MRRNTYLVTPFTDTFFVIILFCCDVELGNMYKNLLEKSESFFQSEKKSEIQSFTQTKYK